MLWKQSCVNPLRFYCTVHGLHSRQRTQGVHGSALTLVIFKPLNKEPPEHGLVSYYWCPSCTDHWWEGPVGPSNGTSSAMLGSSSNYPKKRAWHSASVPCSCCPTQQLTHKWPAMRSAQKWEKHIIQLLAQTGLSPRERCRRVNCVALLSKEATTIPRKTEAEMTGAKLKRTKKSLRPLTQMRRRAEGKLLVSGDRPSRIYSLSLNESWYRDVCDRTTTKHLCVPQKMAKTTQHSGTPRTNPVPQPSDT